MRNNKRSFVPSFLNKLDDKLLRNNPAVWQTRTHLVLFFTALFGAVLSLFCLLVFFDAKQYSNLSGWVTFTGLIAFIGFVFWMIFLLRFNVFKRFGNWFAWDGLKSFVLFFVSIGAMVAVCFIPAAIQTFRANQQFSNEEIVHDINELNTTACKLEYDILPLGWSADTCRVVNTIAIVTNVDTDAPITAAAPAGYNQIDTADLRGRLQTADSTIKINDTLYVFFKCSNYRFVNSYIADEYTKSKILPPAEIFRTELQHYQKPDRPALVKRMNELKTKWAADSRYGSYYDLSYTENDSYETKIEKKYDLRRINNGIDNAAGKKYEWKDNWSSYLRVFYYITLILTMLVFIFRHSTVKTFFLSVLTAVLAAIITGLLMLASYNSSETSALSFIILYYIVFGGIGLSVLGAATRKAIQGIGLNLFLFMTPFYANCFCGIE